MIVDSLECLVISYYVVSLLSCPKQTWGQDTKLSFSSVCFIILVFENKEKIILVMEYADGGEMYDYISSRGRLTENEARKLFRQIVSAVHHLHEVSSHIFIHLSTRFSIDQ